MRDLLSWLRGKRTIGTAVIGLIYLAGGTLGWYETDDRVLAALGLSGLAFLRLGLRSAAEPPPAVLTVATADGSQSSERRLDDPTRLP